MMDPTDSKLREINEIVSSPENRSKNSVSLLLEAASQVGVSVNFNYVDEMGLSTRKLFICEVKVGRLPKCSGSGNNKKMAKANAADQALELIKNRTSPQVFPSHTSQTESPFYSPSHSDRFTQDSPNTAGLNSINPVGSLQEMCVKNNWTLPSYDLVTEKGESHSKTFIYECKVQSWIGQGQGKSKKSAKKLAAENTLSKIKEATKGSTSSSSSGSISSPSGSRSSSLPSSPYRNFPANKWSKIPLSSRSVPDLHVEPSPSHRKKRNLGNEVASLPVPFLSSPLYDEMECEDEDEDDLSFEESSHELSFGQTSHGTSPPVIEDVTSEEFQLLLKDKGKTVGFTATYADMLEKGYSGQYLCFVKLISTIPPLVCCGRGHTRTQAHGKAAQSALEYFNTRSDS